jgi:hypothetical protein
MADVNIDVIMVIIVIVIKLLLLYKLNKVVKWGLVKVEIQKLLFIILYIPIWAI